MKNCDLASRGKCFPSKYGPTECFACILDGFCASVGNTLNIAVLILFSCFSAVLYFSLGVILKMALVVYSKCSSAALSCAGLYAERSETGIRPLLNQHQLSKSWSVLVYDLG